MSWPPFACFNNDFSKIVNYNILNGKTYKKHEFIKDVKIIVDIGANIGASSVYFSRIYPESKIFAFEPASEPYKLLKKNVEQYKNIQSYYFGLYSEDKTVQLYKSKIDSVTGSIGKSIYNTEHTEEITLKETKNFFKELGITQIDILKIDTEGCEIPILKSIQDTHLSNMKIIYIEYHSEEDRKCIDKILGENYILYSGEVSSPHRGEFCYINKLDPDSRTHLNTYNIVIE